MFNYFFNYFFILLANPNVKDHHHEVHDTFIALNNIPGKTPIHPGPIASQSII
jgi:hypothetical protein